MQILDKSRLVIYTGDKEIADCIIYCRSRVSRRKGLLGRTCLAADEGILMELPDSRKGKSGVVNSIHMLGMRFDIAVAWLDYDRKIVSREDTFFLNQLDKDKSILDKLAPAVPAGDVAWDY